MDYSRNSNKRRKRKQRSQIPRIKNKIGVTFYRVAIATVLIAGFASVGAGLGLYMGIIKNAPTLNFANVQSENYTTFIYSAKTGEEIDRLTGKENRVYVAADQIPQMLKNAFVAIEDERFYSHNGVDIRGMMRAVYLLLTSSGGTTQGASTITQQLIKNILGRYDSDLITKLQEQYLAVQFEKRLTDPDMLGSKEAAKDYILSAYMNEINLGRGYYGVQSAAWNYYGKDVSELTISECATIAAITQNPTKYPPDIRPEDNRYRQELVLKKMRDLGFIGEAEFQIAWDDNVYDRVIQGVKAIDGSSEVKTYFQDVLINQVHDDLLEKYSMTDKEAYNWIYNGGLQIFSTQDLEIQSVVDAVYLDPENFPAGDYEIDIEYTLSVKNSITGKITNHEKKKTVKKLEEVDAFILAMQDELLTANDDILADKVILIEQPQSSFIIIDYYTGQVKAISGGRGEKPVNRSFNRATDALRSPGSQFKVVASYAPALDLGRITAATVITDAPYTYNDGHSEPYTPRNWWGGNYEGISNVRRGVYHSMNILAVKNFIATGIDTCFAYLQNFGFSTLIEGEWRNNRYLTDKVPSLPLGGLTDGVKQVELCAAYGAIANLGVYNRPIFYTKVLDHDGNVILENTPDPQQVMRKPAAYVLTDIMRDTLRSGGTGVRAMFDEVKMPIAGKTGTSTDTKDLSFTGYTPYYVASVWLGYDQQKKIADSNGHHLRIWKKIMEEVHRNLPEKDFERPEGVTQVSVCRDSGMLPTELCARDARGNRAYSEIFVSGTQPVTYCEVHQEVLYDNVTGMRANDYCPAADVVTRVIVVDPDLMARYGNAADEEAEAAADALYGPQCDVHSVFTQSTYTNPYDNPYAYPGIDYNIGTSGWDMYHQPTPTPAPLEFPWSTAAPVETAPTEIPAEVDYENPLANPYPPDYTEEQPVENAYDTPSPTDIFEDSEVDG